MAEKKKRPYTKKSDYWNKFEKSEPVKQAQATNNYEPEIIGEPLLQISEADCSRKTTRSGSRTNSITTTKVKNKFKNIDDGLLPYKYSEGDVDVSEAIELCQKAYFNIAVFGSTIDLMVDYANLDLYLKGGSKKSRKFVKEVFKKINMEDFKEQAFREIFRSSNLIMYRLDADLDVESIINSYKTFGISNPDAKIPIKYIILNPVDISATGSLILGDMQYKKVLTSFEENKLKNPATEREKELAKSIEKQSNKRTAGIGQKSFIRLDGDKLHTVFYKKQDYEPMAIPRGFYVLDDLNKKIELKKVDQAIVRSIENVILLVTLGDEPDKGGVNPLALNAMKQIFQNKSVGRVLVSDYTTKAEFVIPDLKKVLGKEKYEVLNKDIKDGLQNFLFEESKYSDMNFKIKSFHKKLESARRLFINDFLQPEIERICDEVGLRDCPTVKFKKPSEVSDEDVAKLTTRLLELGLITPEQGMEVFDKGEFPKPKDMEDSQKEFVKQREKGYYMPLVNTVNLLEGGEEEQNQNQQAIKKAEEGKKGSPTNPTPSGGRPVGVSNSTYSKKNIVEITKDLSTFEAQAFREFASKFGLKRISKKKKEIVGQVCESIVASSPKDQWGNKLGEVLNDLTVIESLDVMPEVLEFSAKHDLDTLAASILYHSTQN